MGQTFKAGDRVRRPCSSYFRACSSYPVKEDSIGGAYVTDDQGDRWYPNTDGGFELVLPEANAALPEAFTHMVLSAIDNEQYLNPLDVLEALGYRVETTTTIVPSTNR